MATPAQNPSVDCSVNVAVCAREAAAARHERYLFESRRRRVKGWSIIKDYEDGQLFHKWLCLPHPELQLDSYLAHLRYFGTTLDNPSPRLEAEVAAAITEEQLARFRRVAEANDIETAYVNLRVFREGMEEIRGVLEAELADEMADFNVDDFNRMEKEDDRAREEARAKQERSSRA